MRCCMLHEFHDLWNLVNDFTWQLIGMCLELLEVVKVQRVGDAALLLLQELKVLSPKYGILEVSVLVLFCLYHFFHCLLLLFFSPVLFYIFIVVVIIARGFTQLFECCTFCSSLCQEPQDECGFCTLNSHFHTLLVFMCIRAHTFAVVPAVPNGCIAEIKFCMWNSAQKETKPSCLQDEYSFIEPHSLLI